MSRLALSLQERQVAPKLKLHLSVQELNNYQKDLNKKLRTEKSLIKNNLKEKETTFKKEFKKLTPKIKKGKTQFIKVNDETCTITHLGRILNCLEDPEYAINPLTINEVVDFTILSSKVVIDGLNFLSKRGLYILVVSAIK